MKRVLAAVIFLSALALAGCIDVSQEIWVNPDASGRVRMDIGVSKSLMSFGEPAAEGESGGFGADLTEKADRLRRLPGVTAVEISDYESGESKHLVLDLSVSDLTALKEIMAAGMAPAAEAPGPGGAPRPEAGFTRLDSGHLEFTYPLQAPTEFGAGGAQSGDTAAAEMSRVMMASMFAGRLFTVTLHAPAIVGGNGDLSGEGTTMTWQFPMADLMQGPARSALAAEVALTGAAPAASAPEPAPAASPAPTEGESLEFGAEQGFPRQISILGDRVALHRGPGSDYSVIDRAPRGARYTATAATAAWYRIALPDGSAGWLLRSEARVESYPAAPAAAAIGTAPVTRARADYLRHLAQSLRANFSPDELASFRAWLEQ